MNNIIKSDSTFYDYEEETNIRVVSLNLEDFNKRFKTDIVLYYDEEYFTPYESSELADYFISTIPDLLFMAHNPFCNELDEWKEFIKFKVEELNNLKEGYQKEWFKILYKNYYPIGIADVEENKYYVINEMNKIVNSI
ncbi:MULTISPECIES: hypothetical protein [unclassified Empedobacter]|uniref:hypothetical protein n=1 Tax=unclassified Empedobacter TaxID=2643773 RepID=UPI0025BF767B|nr:MULTISPECIES: hypothetical protein [unclassified Empedobacter]